MTPCGSNVYTNPNMEIISPSRNVLDLGIHMSGDCTFNYHISSLSKQCANLSGWILRTFDTRDYITMVTLFKSIVLSRLDYGSQLWSPFLIKHITQLEKIQRSFTKHITGMNDMPYHERLKSLGLYVLQRRRERYCIIYIWQIIEGLVPNFSNPIISTVSGRRGRSCVISHVNVGRDGTLAYNSLDGVQSVSSLVYQCIYVQFPRVQFLDSRLNLISSLEAWRIFPACQDPTTAWMMEIVDGGHPVMAWLPIRCS